MSQEKEQASLHSFRSKSSKCEWKDYKTVNRKSPSLEIMVCTKDWIVITILNKLKSLKVAQIKDVMDDDEDDGCDGVCDGVCDVAW